jgi:hypothetical protein
MRYERELGRKSERGKKRNLGDLDALARDTQIWPISSIMLSLFSENQR